MPSLDHFREAHVRSLPTWASMLSGVALLTRALPLFIAPLHDAQGNPQAAECARMATADLAGVDSAGVNQMLSGALAAINCLRNTRGAPDRRVEVDVRHDGRLLFCGGDKNPAMGRGTSRGIHEVQPTGRISISA